MSLTIPTNSFRDLTELCQERDGLRWQPTFSLSRPPKKGERRSRRRIHNGAFEFVLEKPRGCTVAGTSHESSNAKTYQVQARGQAPERASEVQEINLPHGEAHAIDEAEIRDAGPSVPLEIPSIVLYESFFERIQPVVDRYNAEFCKIPVTCELASNPFQCTGLTGPRERHLAHAVMALAGHHVRSPTFLDHHQAALRALRIDLSDQVFDHNPLSMLDTIILLFSFDEAQSAHGAWRIHLQGARNILELRGGVSVLAYRRGLRPKVAILLWWDAITSLISRQECIFPYRYFVTLLSDNNEEALDFYRLCGCPTSLVSLVMQLARLTAIMRRSMSDDQALHGMRIVARIRASLEGWRYSSCSTNLDSEQQMHQDRDAMHCAEAWRHGLLLYLYRVFTWIPGTTIPIDSRNQLQHRARTILDHLVACRDECMVSRQALLPLIFAGCELQDRSSRQRIVNMCTLWDENTRYHLFKDAVPLLQRVWVAQEIEDADVPWAWWGQIVDNWHAPLSSPEDLPMTITFG